MPHNQPILQVEGLSKRVGQHELVTDVSFQVQRGEIFGFLGPNGAGKTTTIRMLVGLIQPTRGTIMINGFDLQSHFVDAIQHVGCIVENPELYPYLTGKENLDIFARMVPPVQEERLQEVIHLVHLEERIDDEVKTYSLGMKQRLGIAQALLHHPKLLILDEPTNGLDPAGIRELRAFIRRLAHEEEISIFISSHILHELQLICDRVAIIHEGKMLQTASMHELIDEQLQEVEWTLSPVKKAYDLLRGIEAIQRVEILSEQRLLVHMPSDQIAYINEKLLEQSIQVSGINPLKPTLEDIFLQMTGGDSFAKSGT